MRSLVPLNSLFGNSIYPTIFSVVKDEGAKLDRFTERCIGWRARVFEGGMWGQNSDTPVIDRVEAVNIRSVLLIGTKNNRGAHTT